LSTLKTVEDFFVDSKKLIGKVVHAPNADPETHQVYYNGAEFHFIKMNALSIGCDNPLYIDPVYATKSRYGMITALPTYLATVRYTVARGAFGDYPISGLVAGADWEWNDVIRVNDRFVSSFVYEDVFQKVGRTGRLIFTKTLANYWNQHKERVGTGHGHWIGVGREEAAESTTEGRGFSETMIYERGTYHYSDEEIKEIVDAYDNEEIRGSMPRYWEEINVGDKLLPIVKGPLTTQDLFNYHAQHEGLSHAGMSFGAAFRSHRRGDSLNDVTGWPYEGGYWEHYDWSLCKCRGLPQPFDVGYSRAMHGAHFITNWMGDDAFLRRIYVQFRKPFYYGDTTWFNGEIVKKYKDKVGDLEYDAVDIKIIGTNQIGELSAPGTATVYLPSRGEPVELPIPHDDRYEDYEEYLKNCGEERKNPSV